MSDILDGARYSVGLDVEPKEAIDSDALVDRIEALEADNARMKAALEIIRQWGTDTLSGPAGNLPADASWYRDGVREMARLAAFGLKGGGG
ncbi:hypothetical protein [Pararhodobacter sp.]|uniref:hypothetical protein n=1 Tax=Pararhodobacter sp. TaxID=2127056 RepID=UPI002FDCC2CA